MINIPGQAGWLQDNKGDGRGTIQSSFNVDLASNQGKLRLTRTKRLAYTDSPTGFGQVLGLERFDRQLFVAAESDDGIWKASNSPFDTLANVPSSPELSPNSSDMLAWNNGLYAVTGNELFYTTDGSAWSEIGSNVLTGTSSHLLASKNDVLYVTDELYKVKSVTSGNTFQGSGSQTLNLNMPGYVITVLMAGIDSLWVGLTSRTLGAPTFMFEWDGEAENAPTARYEVNATGIMAGVVKDGSPYILDSNGRLLAFSGGAFLEVSRLPLNGGSFAKFNDTGNSGRAIHPRGMAVLADELLINVANRTEDVTTETHNDFPSGVWAWSETNGLYHKLSPSYQAVSDVGSSNITDYGQIRCASAGPLLVYETTAVSPDTRASNGGRIVFGMEYYVDADDGVSDTEWGLFADDTRDDTVKAGTVTFPRVMSSAFRDTWRKLYAAFSDLVFEQDRVEVKYRTKDVAPVYADVTWTGVDRFSTNTDLSSFSQGDEITIVQGNGSGVVIHAKELTSGSGSEVILDREPPGIVVGQTAVVKFENYKKVGTITDIAHEGFSIGESNHWVQVKLYMQWTGPRELYGILIDNAASIS